MSKSIFKSLLLAVIAGFFTLSACNTEDLGSNAMGDVDALTDESTYALEQRGNLGRHGCYDLVFPLSIVFSDGSKVEVTSQDSLRHAIRAWHLANGGTKREKPDFVYPIQVIAEDGSVIDVADKAALSALREACHKTHLDSLCRRDSLHHSGFPKHDTLCFTLVFPIQVTKADGTIITINNPEDLKVQAKDEHKRGRGHGKKHGLTNQFQLVFPVTVKKSDGSTITVNSKEELKALREGC